MKSHFYTFWLTNCFLVIANLALAQFEGEVKYQVTYRTNNEQAKAMISMLPKESILSVKGALLRYDQSVAGGGKQSLIADAARGETTFLMQFLGQEFMVKLGVNELEQLEQLKDLKLVETTETKIIQGHTCKMAYSVAGADTLKIFYAPNINVPVVIPQFKSIVGLPLEYEIVKGSVFMHYLCTQITEKDLSEDIFSVGSQVREIPFEDFARSFAVSKN